MSLLVKKLLIGTGVVISLTVLGLFSFYCLCLNHLSVNHIGVAYDSYNGTISLQEAPGWYRTSPFVKLSYISTLPVKVTIPSEAQVIISKIVRFKVEGIEEFIRLQGFKYWSDGEISSILLGYAFSGNSYPFLEIMQETSPETVKDLRKLPFSQGEQKRETP